MPMACCALRSSNLPRASTGHGASIKVSAHWLESCALFLNCCQIVSVTKGMKGCSNLRIFSQTKKRAFCVWSFKAASCDRIIGLASSIYQSQKSSHTK